MRIINLLNTICITGKKIDEMKIKIAQLYNVVFPKIIFHYLV
jgi:hypothetical protein